jgi:NAD-dependent SIR2 family protein deacetylase
MSTIDELAHFVRRNPRLLVITGAGCSQPSGIPPYRDNKGEWQRSTPIQHNDFINKDATRKRYWARSYSGWPAIKNAKPNDAHIHLRSLEELGYIHTLVTQNVDGLHQAAGHSKVVDLHGNLSEVICTQCAELSSRDRLQERISELNPTLSTSYDSLQPDGDASLDHNVESEITKNLVIPQCENCAGILKPNVVFFGGTVPKKTVESIYEAMNNIDALLIVGSSLMVYSGYRFCKRADAMNVPIAAINLGTMRADELIKLKVDQDCTSALTELVATISA